ncbi:hypothetical protein GGF32_007905 [Allomyces javanicus]|nr:hypothetical protein GGF32_007905 [Allomyces javanicus]
MCGIAAQFARSPTNCTAQLPATHHDQDQLEHQEAKSVLSTPAPQVDSSWIKHRGPNHNGLVEVAVSEHHDQGLTASVLHLRGETMVAQPVRFRSSSGGNELILCWNGEVYAGMAPDTDLKAQSDTAFLVQHLSVLDARSCSAAEFGAGIVALFEDLEAEFAMILFNTRLNLVVPSDLAAQVPNPTDFPALNDLDPVHAAAVTNLLDLLSESVRVRAQALPAPSTPTDAPLAVLFSGGLDCTILAALLDRHVPRTSPIHLLNVAFENPRVLTASSKRSSAHDPWAVPDRRTARQALAELQRVAPTRTWRLLEINVSYATAMAHRTTIAALMAPLDTVMDMSIAMAFYFAARAVHADGEVACAAPVLFSGLGADELVAGYGRHRVQWEKGGWTALGEELQLEVDRIASRNLGRDDRIVSHFGKEVRFPYLDKRIVTFLTALPVHWKCDPRYGKGIGDKILLRLVARELGLDVTAKEAKRAVQFGSRTAKMELGTRNVTGTMKVEVGIEQ